MELFQLIPGPFFLLLLWGLFGLAILGTRLILAKGNTPQISVDILPGYFSPGALALLRGGYLAAIEVITFKLIQEEILLLDATNKTVVVQPKVLGTRFVADPLEKEIIAASMKPVSLWNLVARCIKPARRILAAERLKMEQMGLIVRRENGDKAYAFAVLTTVALEAGATIKLILGVNNDKPVLFLVLSMLLLPLFMYFFSGIARSCIASPEGKAYLSKAKKQLFRGPATPETQNSPDPSYFHRMAVYSSTDFAPLEFSTQFHFMETGHHFGLSDIHASTFSFFDNSGGSDSSSDYSSSSSSGDSSSDSSSGDSGGGGGCGGCGGGGD